jgi:hypothetical protein
MRITCSAPNILKTCPHVLLVSSAENNTVNKDYLIFQSALPSIATTLKHQLPNYTVMPDNE